MCSHCSPSFPLHTDSKRKSAYQVSYVIPESSIPATIADTELIVKVHAWAMNPADALIQDMSLPFVTYPLILGEDIAGTVSLAGPAFPFKPGDRILASTIGSVSHKPGRGGS